MNWFQLVMMIVTAPIIIMGAVTTVYAVYISWILLLAVCGSKWARYKWGKLQ